MKDHLNVLNSLSGANKNIDLQSFKGFQPIPEKQTAGITGEDMYDARFKGVELYDEAIIAGMDLSGASEYTRYIGEQSLLPEGRLMMSLAHNSIPVEQVAQMFGLA